MLTGLFLRVWEAWESSLWLDELHTLSHASLPTLAAVRENVAREYHVPLFFLATHLLGGWEEGAALRALPLLSSLLVFVPLAALTRAAGASWRGVALSAWLFACLPYTLHWSTELRPYAWLMLFSAGAVWAAFAEDRSRALRFAVFFLCVLLGIWTHRFMAFVVLSIGFARLLVRAPRMLHLGWLILAGALAVAPSLPWFLGFAQVATERRLEFEQQVGGRQFRPQMIKEFLGLPLRVFVPYMGALGGAWAWLARLGTALLLGGLAASAWGLVRAPARTGERSPVSQRSPSRRSRWGSRRPAGSAPRTCAAESRSRARRVRCSRPPCTRGCSPSPRCSSTRRPSRPTAASSAPSSPSSCPRAASPASSGRWWSCAGGSLRTTSAG